MENKVPPAAPRPPMSREEIFAAIRALPEQITPDDVPTVMLLSALLGVFGPLPQDTENHEEDEEQEGEGSGDAE